MIGKASAGSIAVTPTRRGGDTLVLYTDTGGGINAVWTPVLDRLHLSPAQLVVGGDTAAVIGLPDLAVAEPFPTPGDRKPLMQRLHALSKQDARAAAGS